MVEKIVNIFLDTCLLVNNEYLETVIINDIFTTGRGKYSRSNVIAWHKFSLPSVYYDKE